MNPGRWERHTWDQRIPLLVLTFVWRCDIKKTKHFSAADTVINQLYISYKYIMVYTA